MRKTLDWRTMNAMATEEKTADVVQTLMFAGPSDIAGARENINGYTKYVTPSYFYTQLDTTRRKGDLGWAHTSDYVRVIEEPSLEEDEAENGYPKDTQENNVTKASNANGALHDLKLKYSVILATFVRYVHVSTSRLPAGISYLVLIR